MEPPVRNVPVKPPTGRTPATPAVSMAGGAALLAGLAVVAIVPPAAIVLVWPLLFFVPGWIVVRRVVPDLSPPGTVGAAVVASVFGSTHLVSLLSYGVGFGRLTVILAAVLIAVASLILVRIDLPWLSPMARPTGHGALTSLRRDVAAWVVAGGVGLVVLGVLLANGWHRTPGGWISGGWNWSDLLVHVSIGTSIAAGNFPPEVPYFAGVPLTYHWFADFDGTIASSVAGLDIIGVYFASSALLAAVLALVVWALAASLTGDRRVATIATILVVSGGGMGWLRLVGDLLAGAGDALTLVSQNPYDNSWADGWPFFRIASIFGTGFLPHRATTFGLPGLVTVVLLVVTSLGRRPAGILLAGLLAALLAPFHFFAFPATYLIVLLYVLTAGSWQARTVVRDGLLFIAPVVLAAPFIASAVALQGEAGSFRLVAGWGEARLELGPAAVAFFYLTNLGIPFALAIVAGFVARGMPKRRFLVAWLVALFAVPNVIVVSAVEFDMNKYFQVMWVAAAILAAWLVRRWPRPIIAAVLLASAISPSLVAVWHVRSNVVALGLAQEAAARWIEANTPPGSVFVTDAFINSPVDLAGRLRITTFGPYVSNLGYDPAPREVDTTAIYCDGPAVAAARMATYAATYVLSSGGDPCQGEPGTDFSSSSRFETVYELDGVTIWRLRG